MLIFLNEQSDYDKVETLFNEIKDTSRPKLLLFGDILKHEVLTRDLKMSALRYCKAIMKYNIRDPWLKEDGIQNNEFYLETLERHIQPAQLYNKRLENTEDNAFFHASKCRYLLDTWKEEGWYSYPQGSMKTDSLGVWFHPGSCRQYAMYLGKMEKQGIVFWDCQEEFFTEHNIIDFNTWKDIFSVDKQQWIDTRGFAEGSPNTFSNKPLLEWHVDEDRPQYYLTAYRIQSEIFNFKLPTLIGETTVDYLDLFKDSNKSLEIHMKDNKLFDDTDLEQIMHIPFEEKEWECETFKVIKTF